MKKTLLTSLAVVTSMLVTFCVVAQSVQPSTNFALYPNPASGTFYLNMQGSDANRTVTVTNVIGETVKTALATSSETEITIDKYVPGLYFVTLTSGMSVTTRRLELH